MIRCLWSENSIKSSHKCTREIHTRAHCNPGKCIIVSLLTEWSSNTVSVPVISCTTNRESFELVFCLWYVYKYVLLYLRILLRLSWCLNSQMHTSLSVHFTYGMNEVGGQTCVVMAIWMALHFKDPDFFFNIIATNIWNFIVIFRFFFSLVTCVSSSLSYVHKLYNFIILCVCEMQWAVCCKYHVSVVPWSAFIAAIRCCF